MIINKVRLENIRSYLNQEIIFPEGSILLNGDIGSGKSSVLLAIDFALFGLQKGNLTGNALLRNGKNRGSVELHFSIDGKEVVIKRNLKKSSGSIVQDSGFIIIDGKKKEATASELKQVVLELLNYPQELLTKSKSLVYKYTVYTPQEEMKQILLSDREVRLDILRKVFGIDKYKRIRDNNGIFLSNLKGKVREFVGRIEDLEEKKTELSKKKKDVEIIDEKIKKLDLVVKKYTEEIKIKKDDIKEAEEKIRKFNELSTYLSVKDTELKNKVESRKRNSDEVREVEAELKNSEKEVKEKFDLVQAKKDVQAKENEVKLMETTLKEIRFKFNEFSTNKANSDQIKINVTDQDICPLCKQKVTEEHKKDVLDKENKKIKEYLESLTIYQKKEKEAEKKLDELRKNLKILEQKVQSFEVLKLKIEDYENKNKKLDKLKLDNDKLKKEIGEINIERDKLFSEIKLLKDVEQTYDKKRMELENLVDKERTLAIEIAGYQSEIKEGKEYIQTLEKEIKSKLKVKESLGSLKQLNEWLDKHFNRLINTIERQVMLTSRKDFSDLFEKWFSVLVDNENLVARLDDDYSLLVEQNGYEIDYLHLSGGEKTAAALAYRLALNQVINHLMSAIKTRDLLILDEPTDGFSSEQLDRMKVVLDELTAKQIIIVSHENKIESFVDNVVRFNKKDHITQVDGAIV